MTGAQLNSFRSSKGYDTSPIMHDLMPACPSSVDVFDSIHELHGGDIGTNASTSIHEDMPEPAEPPSLFLESYQVKTQSYKIECRHKTAPTASVLALQVPGPAHSTPRTFRLAPNISLKSTEVISESSTHSKKSYDSPMIECQMDAL